VTSAIYEHRLLARVLAELQWRCGYIREELRREIRWRESVAERRTASGAIALLSEWEAQTGAAARSLQRARASGFLLDVEPTAQWRGMTDLMRRDRRYRNVARLWRLLSERPFVAFQSPAFEMPAGDLPTLYELWCLLEVARCLGSVGTLIDQQLFTTEPCDYDAIAGLVWKVRLAEDTPIARWRRADGAVVALYYQRRYRPEMGHGSQLGSLDPFLRIPDIVVEVSAPRRRPEVIVFDAKYRVAPSGGIPEEALADAYAYHAAIGWEGTPAATGVYLLFPGREGFEAGSVGAIPLLPRQTTALERLICARVGVQPCRA
jgi:large subunit ribosomal protein MRP49